MTYYGLVKPLANHAERAFRAEMIIRRRRTANFTVIGNELFDDERLEADELGILAYLRSRPDKWEVRRPALQRRFRLGERAIKRVINNFLRTGWVHVLRLRGRGGRFVVLYVVLDQPGPELSDEAIRQALSLESSEAVASDAELDALTEICGDAWQKH